ncbi:MAG: biopolymer transporter ExbD [Treponema sp.]|nr:biopolymer transporter ExbD [Treponema sp.]
MKLKREKKSFIIPTNSMSDVAFLLLIFIMLVSLINYRKEVKIDYPEAEDAKKVSDKKNLEIWVDKSGKLYLDGVLSAFSAIEAGIVDAYRKAPETRVHIIADRDTAFENVQQVLGVLQILQYRVVSFVVKDK